MTDTRASRWLYHSPRCRRDTQYPRAHLKLTGAEFKEVILRCIPDHCDVYISKLHEAGFDVDDPRHKENCNDILLKQDIMLWIYQRGHLAIPITDAQGNPANI